MVDMKELITKRFNKTLKMLLFLMLTISLLIPSISYATESKEIDAGELADVNLFSNTEVMSGLSNYYPSLSELKGENGSFNYSQVGLDLLYGIEPKQTTYYGEAPYWGVENDTIKSLENKSKSKYAYINKDKRSFTADTPTKEDPEGIFKYITTYKGDNNGPYNDLHLYGLTRQNNFLDSFLRGLGAFGFTIGSIFYTIASLILGFMITLCNFSPDTILNAIGFEEIQKAINSLVLVGNDGTISPLMVISALIFIVGLVIMIAKRFFSGDGSARAIFQEVAYLVLAAFIAAASLSGGVTTLQKTIQEFGTDIVNSTAAGYSQDNNAEEKSVDYLYQYVSSSNPTEALTKTQIAMSKKPYVDMIISSQFGGYSVDDLYIKEECWPGAEATNIATEGVIGSNLSVSNSSGGGNIVKNIGYYWYCADSNVNVKDPFTKSGSVNQGDPNSTLFVVDFLAAVDANTNSSSETHEKAQAIIQSFNNPGYDAGKMFLLMLLQFMTALVSGTIAIFTVIAKLIFLLGLAVVPVFPILLLIPATRSKCKDLLMVWLVSALKMVIGMILLTLVLKFSAILCANDFVGVLIDFVFMFAMFKLSPTLFIQLNEIFSKYEGRFAATRAMNNFTGEMFRKVGDNRKGRFDRILNARDAAKESKANAENKYSEDIEAEKKVEEAYSNIESEDSLFGNEDGITFSNGDDFLSDDKEYQKKKTELEIETRAKLDDKAEDMINFQNNMEKNFEELSDSDKINEIYNYQRLSELEKSGKAGNKEYNEIVKAQIAMESGIKPADVTDEDISNYKLDENKVKFYNGMQTLSNKDRKNALMALKTSEKSFETATDKLNKTPLAGSAVAVGAANIVSGVQKAVGKDKIKINIGSDGIGVSNKEGVTNGNDVLERYVGSKAKLARAEHNANNIKIEQNKIKKDYKEKANTLKLEAVDRSIALENSSSTSVDN